MNSLFHILYFSVLEFSYASSIGVLFSCLNYPSIYIFNNRPFNIFLIIIIKSFSINCNTWVICGLLLTIVFSSICIIFSCFFTCLIFFIPLCEMLWIKHCKFALCSFPLSLLNCVWQTVKLFADHCHLVKACF